MPASLLSEISTRLTDFSDTPALDASVLIARIIDRPRTWVMAHPELTLTQPQKDRLNDSLTRLERGESFPYVLGHWEFFGLDFELTADVLIPRPETELLVEKAIAWLQNSSGRRTIADIGTGSGAIAVSLAVHVPDAHVLATDISGAALEVARKNAAKFGVQDRVEFVQCDLLPAASPSMEPHVDLICANLPYIPTAELQQLPIFGREPTLALDGGRDGLDLIQRLLSASPRWIAPHGLLLLEIEATRGPQSLQLAEAQFPQAKVYLHQDLTGRDRLLEIRI